MTSEEVSKIYYTCLFVEDKVTLLQKFKPVHKHVVAHHSTIAYTPENFVSLGGFRVGYILKVRVLGRVTDEFGDAILIENTLSEKKYPHITISHAEGVDRNYSNAMIEKAILENKVEYFKVEVYVNVIVGWVDKNKKEYRDDKNFEKWSEYKREVNNSKFNKWCFQREVWWAHMGENVGYEEDGKSKEYARPVVVLRGFGFRSALVVPLTTSTKANQFHFELGEIAGERSFAVTTQIKFFDTRRLQRKIGLVESEKFLELKKSIRDLI